MKKSFLILLLFLCGLCIGSIAQSQNPSDSLLNSYVSQLKGDIDKHDYNSANEVVKQIFALKSTMPDVVAYYYGITMFNLKNYKSAKDAFYKFLTLIDDKNPLYYEAIKFHRDAECHETGYYVQEEECEECDSTGFIEIKCRNCKGTGKEFCPVCGGKGVAKTKDNFGEKYSTCIKCSGSGFILCTRCQGSKMEKAECSICTGKGYVKLKKSCEE